MAASTNWGVLGRTGASRRMCRRRRNHDRECGARLALRSERRIRRRSAAAGASGHGRDCDRHDKRGLRRCVRCVTFVQCITSRSSKDLSPIYLISVRFSCLAPEPCRDPSPRRESPRTGPLLLKVSAATYRVDVRHPLEQLGRLLSGDEVRKSDVPHHPAEFGWSYHIKTEEHPEAHAKADAPFQSAARTTQRTDRLTVRRKRR